MELAEKFKLSWISIIGLVAEIAGLVLVIAGAEVFAIPGFQVPGIILDVIGLIPAVVGVIVTLIDGLGPRVAAAENALNQLSYAINQKIPITIDARVPVPTGEWQRNTKNPND